MRDKNTLTVLILFASNGVLPPGNAAGGVPGGGVAGFGSFGGSTGMVFGSVGAVGLGLGLAGVGVSVGGTVNGSGNGLLASGVAPYSQLLTFVKYG